MGLDLVYQADVAGPDPGAQRGVGASLAPIQPYEEAVWPSPNSTTEGKGAWPDPNPAPCRGGGMAQSQPSIREGSGRGSAPIWHHGVSRVGEQAWPSPDFAPWGLGICQQGRDSLPPNFQTNGVLHRLDATFLQAPGIKHLCAKMLALC